MSAECRPPIITKPLILIPEKPSYETGSSVAVRCSSGYQPKGRLLTVVKHCTDGNWTDISDQDLVCEGNMKIDKQ